MTTILGHKAQIDKLLETFWSNGISNPLTVIKQISYLFFIKELDEKHTREERKTNRLSRPIENPVFEETPRQQNMRWSKFKDFAPSEMFKIVQEDVFPFIKNMGGENFAKYLKDAVFMIPSPALLATAVDMIDKLEMQDLDTNNVLNSEYLSHGLLFKSMAKVSAGSAIHNLLLSTMRAYELPIHPIEHQDKFAQIVEKVETQKQKNEKVIEQMGNLFNSLSQRAFKGEL